MSLVCNLRCTSPFVLRRFQSTSTAPAGKLVAVPEVKKFIERCMVAVDTRPKHATALAENLTAADHRGHFSHGLNRLEMYVNDVRTKMTVSDREPTIIHEAAATAHINGGNLLGPVVGNYSMQVAVRKAREVGVGWVVANGSNHYGIAGWYSMQALKEGYLGMSFTNTSPLVLPTRGQKPVLGTNPLSLAAPGLDGDSYVLDMATSTAAVGKIELNDVKGIPIPSGWGADSKGKETHNPREVLDGGGLLPLGGGEVTSGYKGYGLGLLVEIFCGILADGAYGPKVRKWKETDREANLGHCFIAINPENFSPGFRNRMQDMIDICRGQDTAEGETEVLVPGDPENRHIEMCNQQGGIKYHPNLISNMNKLSDKLQVKPIQVVQ